jgi:hypothetical protein
MIVRVFRGGIGRINIWPKAYSQPSFRRSDDFPHKALRGELESHSNKPFWGFFYVKKILKKNLEVREFKRIDRHHCLSIINKPRRIQN